MGRRLEVVDQSRRDIHQEFVGFANTAAGSLVNPVAKA